MNVVPFTEARKNLKDLMDRVVEDRAPVVVTRANGEAVVVVSLADWNAIEETTRLMSSRNGVRLAEGIAQLDAVQGIERPLIET